MKRLIKFSKKLTCLLFKMEELNPINRYKPDSPPSLINLIILLNWRRQTSCYENSFWESKVNAIIKAKDLKSLTMDEIIGTMKTYDLKKHRD